MAAISDISDNVLVNEVERIEALEKNHCSLPMVLSEVFKDEINANDEHRLYNGIKRIIRKYEKDDKAIRIIDEFVRVISGGASLGEIIRIAGDESLNPSLESEIIIDDTCKH